MSCYKVTQQCIDLIEELLEEGYQGEITLSNCFCTGTANYLEDTMAIVINGFCKEQLHIAEDITDSSIAFFGRYSVEQVRPSVAGIVEFAWVTYQSYKQSGYSMPHEFETLFKKYGYLKQKTIPSRTVWEEA